MRILVIGGYGNFGRRLVNSLLENSRHDIIIAGRSEAKAKRIASELNSTYGKRAESVRLDVLENKLTEEIIKLDVKIVVNASGPFHLQSQTSTHLKYRDYLVAKSCLIAKCYYIDLADHRSFVTGFSNALNKQAIQQGLVFITGASTVPSLTDAVIQHFLPEFLELSSINYGISPGNRTERGQGTVASILSYTGKPFKTLKNKKFSDIFGWQNLSHFDFGYPIGKRWMSNCDIPDLDLLPKKYPELKSVKFQAGLEVSILHIGLWFLSFFSRIGMINNWGRYSRVLTAMSQWFSFLGSDCGGMFIELKGIGADNEPKTIQWQLVAEEGVGPNIPTIPAEILINKLTKKLSELTEQSELNPGARACLGLFTLEEFFQVADRWNIYQKVSGNSKCRRFEGGVENEQ